MTDLIFHMAHQADWERCRQTGAPYAGSADDLRDGFIHFSTAAQIQVSAAKHRFGQTDLLLIAVDPQRLGDALKWEASRGDQLFPHLYGALDTQLAAATWPLPWNDNASVHEFPGGFEHGASS